MLAEAGTDPLDWLRGAGDLVESYFAMEDPARLEPAARELQVQAELPSGLVLRGFVDRLDRAPTGQLRVVDYKTGQAARASGSRPGRCSRCASTPWPSGTCTASCPRCCS